MYELYCKFRDKKGYKDSDVSKLTGIPASTFSDWKSGRSKPNTEKLSKIADVLDTMVEYFDSPKGILITCPDCGLTYVSTEKNDIKKHEKLHSSWQDAEKNSVQYTEIILFVKKLKLETGISETMKIVHLKKDIMPNWKF